MAETPRLRHALFGRTSSLVSAARSRRPQPNATGTQPSDCPFCEGNERETEREVFALRREGSAPDGPGWSLRVVPNKYPALVTSLPLATSEHHPLSEAAATGVHEVIIETPEHDASPARLPAEHLAGVLTIYQDRLRVTGGAPGVQSVVIIRNEGRAAGASQPHPHSQVLALPVVHPRLAHELQVARQHFAEAHRCLTCDVIEHELKQGRRIVALDDEFVVLTSFAPRFPYETWILPRHHSHDFRESSERQIARCAERIRALLVAMESRLGAFPYNLVLLTCPMQTAHDDRQSFHWRFELLPRTTIPSGLELGCDVFIVSVSPEEAADALRTHMSPSAEVQ
jgi:UDPglucose--hexose-1-phosphate uridylyltransferase